MVRFLQNDRSSIPYVLSYYFNCYVPWSLQTFWIKVSLFGLKIYFYPLIVDLVCTNVLCTLCTVHVHTTSLSLILFCLSFATFFIFSLFSLLLFPFSGCVLYPFLIVSSQCSFLSRCPYFPRYSLIAYTLSVAHAGGILIKGTVQRATTGPGSDINLHRSSCGSETRIFLVLNLKETCLFSSIKPVWTG